MKLKLRVASLDTLPKELQGFYRSMEGGGFILDHEPDPDGYGIDNLALIRGKLDEKDRDYQRANKHLQGFKKGDGSLFTLEELQAMTGQIGDLNKTVETLRDKTKTDEQKLAQLVAEAKKPIEGELAKARAQIDGYKQKAFKAEKDKVVGQALDALKPQDRWRKYLAAELERQIEIREGEDGSLSHVVLDGDGRARMSSQMGRNGPMDVAEFASGADLRKTFGDLLQGDGKKGADVASKSAGGNESGAVKHTERDVHLPFEHTQQQFEAAYSEASKRGGEVVIAPEANA
jgi:hypothetical protein